MPERVVALPTWVELGGGGGWEVKVKVKSLSCARLSATPWTVAYQALPSMEFSKQVYWSRLPFPSPGDLPDPGIKPASPALAGGFFTTSTTWEALGGLGG